MIKCTKCGGNLIEVPIDVTSQEVEDIMFILNKQHTAQLCIRPAAIDFSLFKEGQIYEYFKAAYDIYSEAEFLNEIWFRNMKIRSGLEEFEYVNEKLYVHEIPGSCVCQVNL